jgi:ElaA protein
MAWKVKEFDALTTTEIYGIMRLRSEVFVLEQECVYLDADGYDDQCLHLWKEVHGAVVAYTRILPAGVYYPEASIGRVVVAQNARGGDLGKELMRRSEEILYNTGHHGPVKLMAQSYLLKWYGSQGYIAEGDEFLEDGIPHTTMVKSTL